jgi:hypothetical protein
MARPSPCCVWCATDLPGTLQALPALHTCTCTGPSASRSPLLLFLYLIPYLLSSLGLSHWILLP